MIQTISTTKTFSRYVNRGVSRQAKSESESESESGSFFVGKEKVDHLRIDRCLGIGTYQDR